MMRGGFGFWGPFLAGAVLALPAMAQGDGRTLFAQNCAACHQASGKGVPGAFPALIGDKVVTGPAVSAAAIVLNGRGGMPAFAEDLSNDVIAEVLTYVRTAWGNQAGPLTAADVAAARTAPRAERAGGALQAH